MADGLSATVGVHARLALAQVRGQAQYRASFAIDMAGQAVFTLLDFATVVVLFRVAPALAGFDLWQVLLISAIGGAAFAFADLAVGNVERLKHYVRTGLLDAMLIRPRRVLPQLLAVDFQLRRIGRVLCSVAVLVLACARLDVEWTGWRLALTVAAPLVGALFFCGLFVVTASVAFWWIDSGEFANALTYGGREFTAYPMPVFQGAFRQLFGFVLGFGFVAYYPALAIMDKPDPLGLPGWAVIGSPVAALAALGLAAVVWRVGIRHYKGTGS